MAATMAVFELPPKFSRKSQVNTESRNGIKSPFFFLDLELAWNNSKYRQKSEAFFDIFANTVFTIIVAALK